VKDLLGRNFDFSTPPSRVVSLVPSLTETLFDLGAGDAVAGITDFCIFPEGIDRPRVGGTKNPRIDEIRALSPDLVYMNLEENIERHAKAIEEFAPVFVTEPKTVDDVSALIATLGGIHRRSDRARELTEALANERGTVTTLTFAVPIWKKPWMWCGGDTYVSNLVESTGGVNVLAFLVATDAYARLGIVDAPAADAAPHLDTVDLHAATMRVFLRARKMPKAIFCRAR